MRSRFGMLGGMLLLVVGVLLALPAGAARPSAGTADAALSADALPARVVLRLQRAVFDPLLETPTLPDGLQRDAYPGDGAGFYLVQFHGPIQPAWKAELQQAGAVLHDYLPEYAFIVQMDAVTAARVRAQTAVRWVGAYQPAFRLSTDLDPMLHQSAADQTARIAVRAFAGQEAAPLLESFKQWGAEVADAAADSGGGAVFKLMLAGRWLPALARLGAVSWIEPWAEPRLFNEVSRSPLIMDQETVGADLGLYGAGQIVVVGDTGVSTGNAATMHPDFQGRLFQGTWGSGSCGSWADYYAHGTHVAGSVLGSGLMDGSNPAAHDYAGTNAGIAPEAQLWAWGFCSNWSGLPDTDPYVDYYGVMYGGSPDARINTNSWGYNLSSGTYNTYSRETDRFVWDHPDMLVVFSAGNDGLDGNGDGVVDANSMGVPAGAKNILTVGASENYRLTGGYNPGGPCDAYGDCWPSDYPANPVRDDLLSDDPSGMVAYSSRGPVLDGRLKPDVVAPGTNVLSTRHAGGSGDPLWGAYNEWYSYCGGTSMSAPLAAGASAIVREFFQTGYAHDPTAPLIKATLINGAVDLTPGQYRDEFPDGSRDDVIRRPDVNQGWGRISLSSSLLYALPHTLLWEDHADGLQTGEWFDLPVTVTDDQHPLRVTLVWADYPGIEAAHGALVNDLDLQVIGPGGVIYRGNDVLDGVLDGDVDRTNNVEAVDLALPSAGSYLVRVAAYNVPQGPQPFALVVSGDMGAVGHLSGSVTDASNGSPLDAAAVRAITGTIQFRTSTDPTGYYSMPVAADTYSVSAWKYGYSLATVEAVHVLSGTVVVQDLSLLPTGRYSLTGCITDQVTGAPLSAGLSVFGPFGDLVASATAPLPDGCYGLTLHGGAYTLRARARLHQDASISVDLLEDTVRDVALVATTTDGLLFGQITNRASGEPLSGATIRAMPGGVAATSLADGTYEMLLAPGSYTVTVSAPLFGTLTEPNVAVPQSNLVRRDYALPTAHLVLVPAGGTGAALRQGKHVTQTLVISNTGEGALEWEIRERDRGFTPDGRRRPLSADVLLVNRYSVNAAADFKTALDSLGYSYQEMTETEFAATPLENLLTYGMLIWAGSTGYSGAGDNANEVHLMAYLDAGGSILHVDNDLGYYRHGATYYDQYLHSVYGLDDATPTDTSPQIIHGLGLMAGLDVDLTTELFPDGVQPRDPAATPLFVVDAPVDPNFPYVGLAVEDSDYRALYWAFDFNYASDPAQPPVRQDLQRELVRRAADWLMLSDIPWLAVEVISGTLPGGQQQAIELAFDARIVTETGLYQGTLQFKTNDPAAQPYLSYPVSMTLVPAPPDFAIGVRVPSATAEVGLALRYTLVVTNTGGRATGITVGDPIPAGTLFAWAEDGGDLVGDEVQWSGLQLPIGSDPLHLSFGVTVTCVPSGTLISNQDYRVQAAEWPTPTRGVPGVTPAVSQGVTADFSYESPILVNQTVLFQGVSQRATWHRWDMGDGNQADEPQVRHTYTGEPGFYTVVYTAGNLCNLAVAARSVQVDDYRVGLDTPQAAQSGDPGTVVTYTLTVTNQGTLPDSVRVSAGSHAWPLVLSTTTLALDPGESGTVEVEVTVPADAQGNATDAVTISARSLTDPRRPQAAASLLLVTTANPVYRLGWGPALQERWAVPGEVVVYTLWVTNSSNLVDTVTFARAEPGWPTALSTSSMAIASGGRRQITAWITVPPGSPDGQVDGAAIQATSAGSGQTVTVHLVTTSQWFRLYLPVVVRGRP